MLAVFTRNNSLVSLFRFFKESKFSNLIKLLSNATLGMFGQESFEQLARDFMLATKSDDMPDWMNVVRGLVLSRLDNKAFSSETYAYFEHPNATGETFTDFDGDPAPISQVKIILNAFYYAEQALLDIESYDLDNLDGWLHVNSSLEVFNKLKSSTISHVYKLAHLLTHPDVDLTSIFSEECTNATSWFDGLGGVAFLEQLKSYAKTHSGNISEKTINAAYNVGMAVGVGVNQLQPHQGDLDYVFMTNFSSMLPNYLNQLAEFIQQYSPSVANIAPTLDKAKLNQLEVAAHRLLSSLNGLYTGRGVLLSANLLNYIHIVRNTLTIARSIFSEIGHLNDASQNVIISHFKTLKYEFFLTLVGCADKREEEMMLDSGQLSQHLMISMRYLYSKLVTLVETVVDFSKNNGELRELDDVSFMRKRLLVAYKRHATHEVQVFLLDKSIAASDAFFNMLQLYSGQRLSDLKPEIKLKLIEEFHWIKSYIVTLDVKLSNIIVRSLLEYQTSWSLKNSIFDLADSVSKYNIRKLTGDYPDRIADLLPLRNKVGDALNKLKKTSEFYQVLSNNIIERIHSSVSETSLCTRMNTRDFTAPLCDIVDEDISLNEIIQLYHDARVQVRKVELADCKLATFQDLLSNDDVDICIYELSPVIRKKLRENYCFFQEIVMTLVSPGIAPLSLDCAIVKALAGESQERDSLQVRDINLVFDDHITEHVIKLHTALKTRISRLQAMIMRAQARTILKQDHEDDPRKSYLVKDKHYARDIGEIHQQLRDYYELLNAPIQEQLKVGAQPEYLYGEPTEISFPEITQTLTLLSQPKQLVAIKQLDNSLQKLRDGFVTMEELNDNSYEVYYVWQVFELYDHFKDAVILLWYLPTDPYLQQLSFHFSELFNNFNTKIQQTTKDYQTVDGQNQDGILSIVNALMLSPDHLTSIVAEQDISSAQVLDIHRKSKRISDDIHRIIDESGSYFRLFFEIGTVYNLSQQLQEKLAVFANVSHDVLLDNLASIKDDLFASFLQQIDSKEEELGLKNGVLSTPMQNILDRAFQGVIEQLGLGMDHRIRLMVSMRSFEVRINASLVRKHALERLLQDVIQEKATLFLDESTDETLITSFQALLPMLKNAGPKCQAAYHVVCDRRQAVLDELLTLVSVNQIARDKTRLIRVKQIIELCGAHLDGIAASHSLALQSNNAQSKYLITQRDLKREDNEKFTNNCLKSTIGSLRDACLGKNSVLYDEALSLYIAEKESVMITRSYNGANLDVKIKAIFNEEKSLFDQTLGKYYQQLEVIQGAVAGLEKYLAQDLINIESHVSATFENLDTITKKREQIALIKNIIADKAVDPDKRITQIRDKLNDNSFKDVLLDYEHHNALTYSWWLECVNWLYECLGLYKPERRVHYEALVSSSSNGFFQATPCDPAGNIITPILGS